MSKFTTLLLAHHGGDNHAIRLAVKQFSDNVRERSEGQVTVASVPNCSLGNLPELLRMVVDGRADMALPPYDRLGVHAPRFGCVAAPFVFADHAHADRFLDGEFNDWAVPQLDALGVVLLGSWEWGFRQISNSRRPIRAPDDLRGLRIRVPPVPPYRTIISALGGVPVMVEFARLVSVIRQGLIDGQENPVSVFCSLGVQGEQKYLSLLNHSYGILGHLINRNCYDRLSPQLRQILHEESLRAGQLMRQLVRLAEAQQLAALARDGVLIDRPESAPFMALMQPVHDELAARFGSANMCDFMAMVARAREAAEVQ